MSEKPARYPRRPFFSSGPCAKRPGWSPATLEGALLGRSHRSAAGRAKLEEVITRHRALLHIPEDWRLAIVPASDTGAVEMAMWNLLGARGVDVLAWEVFGRIWADDARDQLRLPDLKIYDAAPGYLPDLARVDWSRDVVFPWNGTTSGVCIPHADWIADDRKGLAICDATSALFAMDVPWKKLDVVTWSWQKALGGEAAHGMLALGPRAVERLHSYTPPWPLPKILRLTTGRQLNEALFVGETLNTPSLLCVEDILDALKWAEGQGGLLALQKKSSQTLALVREWVNRSQWAAFLAEDPATISCSSICLKIVAPWFLDLGPERQVATARAITDLLEAEGVGFDLASYRGIVPGIRIWAGATVLTDDVACLLPWLDWAVETVSRNTKNSMQEIRI
ncbi:phosphoserine transaminase [Haematospirillum sp. H1815]|uniref:phosphoserine transaminase n=1 Tax=Haematospirillum sp. H1815 TaxID=2723108 RepID=UPI00143A3F69|nr:phosphoserine transaminase [Haematospirillum sp. H1815]NKD77114.1 phosphoserine transaminase [Haematospirillum sp. H1815]